MQEQMDLAPQQVGEFGAGLAADFLDPLALVAKDNRALVVAGDQDLLVDFGAAVLAVREFLGLDGGLVGQFLVELAIELLARNLGRQDARSEEHTSELQSLMRISYAVF